MSKDKIIDEFLSLGNLKNHINWKFSDLNDRFNNFQTKYKMVNFNLSVSKCCNELLIAFITLLECKNLNNAQCNRKEVLKINLVPLDITHDVLEQSADQALSLTGTSVEPDVLQFCHPIR